MSLEQLNFWVWVVAILTISAVAFWVGGASERLGAAAILGGWLATFGLISIGGAAYGQEVAAIDIMLLAVLIALALKSSRFWPLWAAGFHLLAVVTHWMHELDPTVGHWTYVTAGIIWGYLLLAALAYGVWGAWRERRQLSAAA